MQEKITYTKKSTKNHERDQVYSVGRRSNSRRLHQIQNYFFSIDIRNNRFKRINCKYHRKFYPRNIFGFISKLEFRLKIFFSNSDRILWFPYHHVFICSRKYNNNRKQTNSKYDDKYIANVGFSFLALYGGRILITQFLQ